LDVVVPDTCTFVRGRSWRRWLFARVQFQPRVLDAVCEGIVNEGIGYHTVDEGHWGGGVARLRRQASTLAVTALVLAVGACGGGGSSSTPQQVSPAAKDRYCDVARAHQHESTTNLFIELKNAAPTSQVRKDAEAVLAANDPTREHYKYVQSYTLGQCGVALADAP
jgi:hypothetical protein